MSRIIGCKNLHIAKLTKDDATGATWEQPVPVKSLISISITDQKENVTFYSDDSVEEVIPTFGSKEVSIELGNLTPEIEAMISGNTYENGVFVQDSNSVSKEYALLFRAPLSKGGFQYVCLYKGVLSRTESNYKSKEDSIEGQTVTLNGVFMPLVYNGNVAIKANSTDVEADATIKKWFTEVQLAPAVGMRTAKEK